MNPLNDVLNILKKDWKLLALVNVFYFGLVLIGAIIAIAYPQAQMDLIATTDQGFSEGPLSSVGEAYGSGNVLQAAAVTFAVNLIIGTLAVITIPSLIFPPWAIFMGAVRSLMWGIMLVVPVPGILPIDRALPHYITLLIEGEAYVVAIFACVRQIVAIFRPKDFGADSRLKAYVNAVIDNVRLLIVVAILLAVAALYEAWEVMFFAGILS